MGTRKFRVWLLCGVLLAWVAAYADDSGELRLRFVSTHAGNHRAVPAVLWLQPLGSTPALPFVPSGQYRLLQKNRTFIPHLLVIPVGSVVQFPNDDPFFHNVFSEFDGKVFNLGLYEAGSTKSVTFSRKGVSYIFCNIHPEMSAVVLTLTTPLYAVADSQNSFVLRNIPPGNYRMHLWIEGMPEPALEGLERDLHLTAGVSNLGDLKVAIPQIKAVRHSNMYGKDYDENPAATY